MLFALQDALQAVGAPMDEELQVFFNKYCFRRFEQRLHRLSESHFYRRLLFRDEAYRIGNKLSEIIGLIRIIASVGDEMPIAIEAGLAQVDAFRKTLNQGLLAINPGYGPIKLSELKSHFTGKGIKVAVYDVFDSAIFEMQKRHYPRASFEETAVFGNPVSLDHGNSVIDALLAIAPDVQIIPVSSDTASMTAAMQYLSARKDIFIVNMSRPLKLGKDGGLDPSFRDQFQKLLREKIVVKALGNSGTDLTGRISEARRARQLAPTGDMTSYDSRLIADLLKDLSSDHLILAQNWTISGDAIALSATVPGDNETARERTVGAPGEGVYSFATGNFEAGSSFAAPQIAAVAALLLQAQIEKCETLDLSGITESIGGDQNIIDGDAALRALRDSLCH